MSSHLLPIMAFTKVAGKKIPRNINHWKIHFVMRVPYSPGPTLFLLYINDHPDDVICDIAIYADDSTLYSKCDQIFDLWQQLELASEHDLQDTMG